MDRRNIAAYTNAAYSTSFPEFVSINREPDGRITLLARERGHNGNKMVSMEIADDDLLKLARSVIDWFMDDHNFGGTRG